MALSDFLNIVYARGLPSGSMSRSRENIFWLNLAIFYLSILWITQLTLHFLRIIMKTGEFTVSKPDFWFFLMKFAAKLGKKIDWWFPVDNFNLSCNDRQ